MVHMHTNFSVTSGALAPSRPSRIAHLPCPRRPVTLTQRHIAVRAGEFDEGAAQVRRLLDRDRLEVDFEKLEDVFADKPRQPASTDDPSTSTNGSTSAPTAAAAQKGAPVSPLGYSASSPSFSKPVSPFTSSGASPSSSPKSPFTDFKDLRRVDDPVEAEPSPPAQAWWTRITLTQVVIVLSFTTIISLMVATFFFVVKVGGVHFNE